MADNFFDKIRQILLQRKKEVKEQISDVKQKDPYMQEYLQDGTRNMDEMEEEVADLQERVTLDAIQEDLTKESKDIDAALKNIKEGDYGVCEVCQEKISIERLKANPTAKTCIKHAE